MQFSSKVQALVVGLGNPGPKYDRTRHNIGFGFLDYVADSGYLGGRNSGSAARINLLGAGWGERFGGLYAEAEVLSDMIPGVTSVRIALLKPLTFMNRSGSSVGAAVKKNSLKSWQVIVCHDELDIPFGDVRAKRGGGEAGHNGLKSISQALCTKDYHRIRLGIGRPESRPVEVDKVGENGIVEWVLGRFSPDEKSRLPDLFDRAGSQLAIGLGSIVKSDLTQ